MALTLAPSTIGPVAGADPRLVVGVVMDMTTGAAWATLVAIVDCTTSMYFSNGSGLVGMAGYDDVARASRELLCVAEEHVGAFPPGPSTALPAAGRSRLTLLTHEGSLGLEDRNEDLRDEGHPAAPVFRAAHRVIAAIRLTKEGRAVAGTPPVLRGGATPLMGAAHLGDTGALARLIGERVDLEARDDAGYTALMYAANAGREEMVRALLAHGADPNASDRQLSAPLMFAAQRGHLGIVRQLLAAGAAPNARGDHGFTALGLARRHGHEETAAALVAASGLL